LLITENNKKENKKVVFFLFLTFVGGNEKFMPLLDVGKNNIFKTN
jgi:hypothetical protein